jgi:hypothetical protein
MIEKEKLRIEIAKIVFSIVCSEHDVAIQFDDSYRKFISAAAPEIVLKIHFTDFSEFISQKKKRIFDSYGPWSLYDIDGKRAIVIGTSDWTEIPSRIAVFEDGKQVIDIFAEEGYHANGSAIDPLQYPLAEVLMMCLLAQGRGVMMHACGVIDGERGYLFAGNSGHGKSTLAKLWKNKALILNDDRIILREHQGSLLMYGTPWRGDYRDVSPLSVPLEKIFFLRHGYNNKVNQKKSMESLSALFSRSFPPFWDAQGIRFTLDFCTQLAETIPCYELEFFPDQKITDFVRCLN